MFFFNILFSEMHILKDNCNNSGSGIELADSWSRIWSMLIWINKTKFNLPEWIILSNLWWCLTCPPLVGPGAAALTLSTVRTRKTRGAAAPHQLTTQTKTSTPCSASGRRMFNLVTVTGRGVRRISLGGHRCEGRQWPILYSVLEIHFWRIS